MSTNPWLKAETKDIIVERLKAGVKPADVAKEVGVSLSLVYQIRKYTPNLLKKIKRTKR